MAHITLNTGDVVLIDDADYPLVSQYNWRLRSGGGATYAITNSRNEGKRTTVSMHRLIMGEGALAVDHVNRNGLDNRRSNLRWATRSENGRNSRPSKGRRFKGVYFKRDEKYSKPWEAQITVDGKNVFLGCYSTEEEGARAYDAAAKRYFGEFACLNFPEGAINGCTTHPNL